MCSLVGKWKIFQKQGGHRFSTDDVTTAWVACKVIKELQERGVDVLRQQQVDLSGAIDALLDDIAAGRKYMKVYKQMKMYNDPELNPVLYASK